MFTMSMDKQYSACADGTERSSTSERNTVLI